MSLFSLAILLSGCHRESDPSHATVDGAPSAVASAAPTGDNRDGSVAEAAAAAATATIAWDLTAEPSTAFPMRKRGEFELWIVARNDAPTIADTERNALRYEVNGQDSMMLTMAFDNGARDRRWRALPPGETLREARGGSGDPTFGQELFPAPGDYHLRLRRDGQVVAGLDVRVSP